MEAMEDLVDVDALIETEDYVLLGMLQQRLKRRRARPALWGLLDPQKGEDGQDGASPTQRASEWWDESSVEGEDGATPTERADESSVEGQDGVADEPSLDGQDGITAAERADESSVEGQAGVTATERADGP